MSYLHMYVSRFRETSLNFFQDAYDEHMKHLLSLHGASGLAKMDGRERKTVWERNGGSKGRGDREFEGGEGGEVEGGESSELFELRRRVHKLEVQSRATLMENGR